MVRPLKRLKGIFPLLLALCVLGTSMLVQSAQPARAATASNSGGSIWGADYFPNSPLITHDGKTVHFFTDLIKDKVVVINFIYTSCPDECALETARLAEVQKILGDRVGKDVFMYSITIDPANDTPKVLKGYAQKFEAGPGWLFLTGKDADITQIRVKLGLYTPGDKDGKLQDHNLSLIIGNQATGRWTKISPHENPYMLATQLGNWLHNFNMPPAQRDYANAPQVRQITQGENLYRIRCSACHKIGAPEASGAVARAIGPDLFEITKKRDRSWLTRWIMEPDKMLSEKDPLALALLAQYNNLPMPNMRLNNQDTGLLLQYLEEESQRVAHLKQHNHSAGSHDHQHGGGHSHDQGHEGHMLHEQ